MPNNKILAVVSVHGKDQKGVVARVSTYLAERSVNIEDIEQHVLQGLFIMNMLVDLSDLDEPLDSLIAGLRDEAARIGMEAEVRLVGRRKDRRFVVLVSKERHCLDRIFADIDEGLITAELAAVLSNHDALEPHVAVRGIPFHHFPEKDRLARDRQMLETIAGLSPAPNLIVLARYMQVLTPEFVAAHPSRIVNIHPSLLPYHPGANAYRQAFEMGRRVAGCTAHFVTETLDEGPIILQDVFHIAVGKDSLDDVRAKGQALEANVLSKAIQLYLNDELVVRDNKVVFKPGFDFFRKHHSL